MPCAASPPQVPKPLARSCRLTADLATVRRQCSAPSPMLILQRATNQAKSQRLALATVAHWPIGARPLLLVPRRPGRGPLKALYRRAFCPEAEDSQRLGHDSTALGFFALGICVRLGFPPLATHLVRFVFVFVSGFVFFSFSSFSSPQPRLSAPTTARRKPPIGCRCLWASHRCRLSQAAAPSPRPAAQSITSAPCDGRQSAIRGKKKGRNPPDEYGRAVWAGWQHRRSSTQKRPTTAAAKSGGPAAVAVDFWGVSATWQRRVSCRRGRSRHVVSVAASFWAVLHLRISA